MSPGGAWRPRPPALLVGAACVGRLGALSVARDGDAPRSPGAFWQALESGERSGVTSYGASGIGPVSVRLNNIVNMQYHGDITIGGQSLRALYDTGSFDVITLSSLCKTCHVDRVRYDSGKSESFKESGRGPMVMRFGSGAIKAEQDVEDIRLGDASSAARVSGMPFWQVIEHTMPFWETQTGGQFSAIVGLCHPAEVPLSLALGNARDTVLERLKIDRFAFCLPSSGAGVEDGWLTVGLPASAVSSGFVSVPLLSGRSWAVELTAPRLGGEALGACAPTCAALVDSGSSLLLVPQAVMTALENAIARSPPSDDCSDVSGLPPLEFELGGAKISLPPEAYMVEDTSFGVMLSSCKPAVAAVQRSSSAGPLWSLGLPFLRRYHTIFDRSGPRLHIGASGAPCGAPATLVARHAPSAVHLVGRRGAALRADSRYARLPTWASNASAPMEL